MAPVWRVRNENMFDLPAMPIAFALTLWDAAPIFLSVSLALAVIARATTGGRRFAMLWHVRNVIGAEGMVYLAVFQASLAPLLLAACLAIVLTSLRQLTTLDPGPGTPGRALRVRAEEVIFPVLVASAVAAYIKVAGPHISDYGWWLEVVFAAAAGAIAGNRSGAVAIPTVAVMVHLGGTGPAIVCILAGTIRSLIPQSRSADPEVDSTVSSLTG